jgi:hypothetical protein
MSWEIDIASVATRVLPVHIMATLNELFAGMPAVSGATVRSPRPEVPTATGAPPGDNRYGKGSPLTDQFAGRTLAQLLEDAGEQVDPQTWIRKNLKPEKPPVFSGAWGAEKLYFRGGAAGLGGLPTADQLMVITTQEAQTLLAGGAQPVAAPGPGGGLLA